MAENYITTETGGGKLCISEEVIGVMVREAILEVEGVSGMSNTVGNDILEFIGVRTLSKGVKISMDGDVLTADVLIMVDFGKVITQVAENVQAAVTNALESMTGITPVVNVHVSGVSFKAGEK